jgi:hypothetical protein
VTLELSEAQIEILRVMRQVEQTHGAGTEVYSSFRTRGLPLARVSGKTADQLVAAGLLAVRGDRLAGRYFTFTELGREVAAYHEPLGGSVERGRGGRHG